MAIGAATPLKARLEDAAGLRRKLPIAAGSGAALRDGSAPDPVALLPNTPS